MQLLTRQFVPTVYLVGWVPLAKTTALMGSRYLWTAETAFVIHVTQVSGVPSNVQDTELALTKSANVIHFKDGEVPCAKCLGVLDLMGRIAAVMGNVIVQTTSASVNQVTKK